MNLAAFALPVALAVLLDTWWVVLFRAQPVGSFKVLLDGTALFRFSSKVGVFSVFPKERRLDCQIDRQRRSLAFADIRGIEYRVREEAAVLQELFFGATPTDFLAPYRDTIDWFSIAVVTHDGQRLPLYLSGQYARREFLLGWYIDAQAELLQRLGLVVDVEACSRQVLDLLRLKLGSPPLL